MRDLHFGGGFVGKDAGEEDGEGKVSLLCFIFRFFECSVSLQL